VVLSKVNRMMTLDNWVRCFSVVAFGILLSAGTATCFADVVGVNGTCIAGSSAVACTVPATLESGDTASSNFNYVYTLSNEDQYLIYGYSSWSNSGNGGFGFYVYAGAEYLGNNGNAATPSQADMVTITDSEVLDLVYSQGTYNEGGLLYFVPTLGAGSTGDESFSVDGSSLPNMHFTGTNSLSNNGIVLTNLTEPALIVWTQTADFGAGSLAGSEITAIPTPEPGYYAFSLIAALGLAGTRAYRKRVQK